MFLYHVSSFLGLIALCFGVALYAWSARREGAVTGLASIVGVFVMVVALFGLFCNFYFGFKYWQQGYFQAPMCMMKNMELNNAMANNDNTMPDTMMNTQTKTKRTTRH